MSVKIEYIKPGTVCKVKHSPSSVGNPDCVHITANRSAFEAWVPDSRLTSTMVKDGTEFKITSNPYKTNSSYVKLVEIMIDYRVYETYYTSVRYDSEMILAHNK